MKSGDLVYYNHRAMHWEDPCIGTVLKIHSDHRVTIKCSDGRKKKILEWFCKPITRKEAFKLRLEGAK